MATPPCTIISPHLPLPPVPEPIPADCEFFMPALSLPPPVATTRNTLPLPTSLNPPSCTSNQHRLQPINHVYTLSTAGHHFPMIIEFHPPQVTTNCVLSLFKILLDTLLHRLSPLHSLCAFLFHQAKYCLLQILLPHQVSLRNTACIFFSKPITCTVSAIIY